MEKDILEKSLNYSGRMTFVNCMVGIASLVFFNINVMGQLVWSTPVINSDNGALVGVDLLVTGYQNIISAQGTIEFDEAVLEYSSVNDFGLPSISVNSFGVTEVNAGRLSFSWYESDLIGKTISDNEKAFTIYFNVIGYSGESSPIQLIDQPVVAEFVDASFTPLAYTYQNGSVTVNGTANIENVSMDKLNVFPNPAKDWVQIESNMISTGVQVLWYTEEGILIKKDSLISSSNAIKLTTEGLTKGMYMICVGNDTLGFDNRLIQIL